MREPEKYDKKFYFLLVFGILMLTYFLHSSFTKTVIVVDDDLKVKSTATSFDECVAEGNVVMESYPRQCRIEGGKNFVEDIGNSLEKQDLIRIDNLMPNQVISSPVKITGEARGYWFFEASFPVKILDENNNVLGSGIATALSDWMTKEFVSFEIEIEFELPETKKGFVVLEKDNPSGLEEYADELKIPISFVAEEVKTMTVRAFFNNSILDPEVSCNKVFAVERVVPKTKGVANTAVVELLKGVTMDEAMEGYSTAVNENVKINSLVIENGVAKIDFDDKLDYLIAGSCMVSTIRAQIEETLKQFDTIDEVIISINGKTEDILQP